MRKIKDIKISAKLPDIKSYKDKKLKEFKLPDKPWKESRTIKNTLAAGFFTVLPYAINILEWTGKLDSTQVYWIYLGLETLSKLGILNAGKNIWKERVKKGQQIVGQD